MNGAVAVDLGATSARYALGRLDEGRIEFDLAERIPHAPVMEGGVLRWDLPALMGLVERAAAHGASTFQGATLGIDAWGVDHGFLDDAGDLMAHPVAYRDPSHAVQFERLAPFRDELYGLTGVQAQPFNTLYQLAARVAEDPSFCDRAQRWLLLPDLIGFLMTGEAHMEATEVSTTGLAALDGGWSARAFEIAGWPVPDLTPRSPGELGGYLGPGVRLATVGSHDTASAVAGLGTLGADDLFLNVGTWSLVGTVIDQPVATEAAREANLTNERTVDGRVRLLRNVPGFWIVNRLHEELGVPVSVPEWLQSARRETDARLDLFDERFFNPPSMVAACGLEGLSPEGWAEVALRSMVLAIADTVPLLAAATGRTFRRVKVGGGGSRDRAFLRALGAATGLVVEAGPAEATLVGNLAVQFLAQGRFADHAEMLCAVDRSNLLAAGE